MLHLRLQLIWLLLCAVLLMLMLMTLLQWRLLPWMRILIFSLSTPLLLVDFLFVFIFFLIQSLPLPLLHWWSSHLQRHLLLLKGVILLVLLLRRYLLQWQIPSCKLAEPVLFGVHILLRLLHILLHRSIDKIQLRLLLGRCLIVRLTLIEMDQAVG